MKTSLQLCLVCKSKNTSIKNICNYKLHYRTDLMTDDIINRYGTQQAGYRAYSVRDSHQYTSISRRNIQMIYVETCNTSIVLVESSLGTKVRLGTLDRVYIMLYYIGIVTGNGESTERYAAGQRYRGCKGSMSRGQHEEKCSFHSETAAVEYLSNASRGKCAGFS